MTSERDIFNINAYEIISSRNYISYLLINFKLRLRFIIFPLC